MIFRCSFSVDARSVSVRMAPPAPMVNRGRFVPASLLLGELGSQPGPSKGVSG
jgi:hypothetical protein